MARSKVYMVGIVKNFLEVEMEIKDTNLKARGTMPCTWAEGMIGAFPVFQTAEAAFEYAGPENAEKVIEWEVEVPEHS